MKKLFLILLMTTVIIWANIGTIMVVKGKADVKRSTKILTAKNGMELLVGDEIITKIQSRVQVMLKDDTIITIGPKSSFGFDDFIFDGTKNSKISLKSNRGFFRSVTGKISKIAPERFKVKTVSATIGIRGTDFSGEIIGDVEIIKCYKGSIYVEFEGISRAVEAGNMIELGDTGFKTKRNISIMKMPKKAINNRKLDSIISNEVIRDITQKNYDNIDKYEIKPIEPKLVEDESDLQPDKEHPSDYNY